MGSRGVSRWHLYRDDQLVMDHGTPRVFNSRADALWAGRHWTEFRLPTQAELDTLAEGELRAQRVVKGSDASTAGV